MSKTTIIVGDCREELRELPDASVNCCVTSPPYFGLRDYGVAGQMGLEPTPDEFVSALAGVFREVRRVLRDDGTVWLNLGDSYANGGRASRAPDAKNPHAREMSFRPADGLKAKDLIGIPWRVAFALQADGWYLRQDIIWHKPNPMPESVKDRCTKAHEYLFLLSKAEKYYFDGEAIKEKSVIGVGALRNIGPKDKGPVSMRKDSDRVGIVNDGTRNKRSVWTITPKPFKGAHFATFPPDLIEPCILAGSPVGGVVLDPFNGAGTTGLVAMRHGRDYVGIELNPTYAEMARERIEADRLKVSKARSIYDASESQN